jgi:hypothetical protein
MLVDESACYRPSVRLLRCRFLHLNAPTKSGPAFGPPSVQYASTTHGALADQKPHFPLFAYHTGLECPFHVPQKILPQQRTDIRHRRGREWRRYGGSGAGVVFVRVQCPRWYRCRIQTIVVVLLLLLLYRRRIMGRGWNESGQDGRAKRRRGPSRHPPCCRDDGVVVVLLYPTSPS